MQKILIIGSKGFIGSHTFKYFSKKYDTFGVDIINDYNAKKYFQIDATNSDFRAIFQQQKYDFCINCSGAASVPLSFSNPAKDFELNTAIIFKILSAIKEFSPQCKFLNISSAAVYGNPTNLPITETQTLKPISPYGKHKLMAEQICEEFYTVFNIPTLSARIFSAYGEGLQKQLFWDLYKKTKSKKHIELWGTGDETRDYIYINDIVRAFELILKNVDFSGQAINLASGKQVKIKDTVKLFFDLFNPDIKYQFQGQNRKGDPLQWLADIEKLKKIGFSPVFSLQQGLNNYIQWLKKLDSE